MIWTEKDIEFMKTHTTKETAEYKGCSLNSVYNVTKEHGIRCKSLHERIYDEILPFLGKMSDRELGERFGITHATVQRYRSDLNIEPYRRHSKTRNHKYSKEYLEELHDELGSWKKVGEKLGCSKQSINQMYRNICLDLS